MNAQLISQLKQLLEETAFSVVAQMPPNQVHAKIVECLVLVAKMTDEGSNTTQPRADNVGRQEIEVNQVVQRLPRWRNRPQQINSRILTAFLALRNKGNNSITQEDIKEKFNGDPGTFDGNFNQMINFGDHNHGKVFERNGAFIEIWEPVQEAVARFENS